MKRQISGTFADAANNPVALGMLEVRLNQDASTVTNEQISSKPFIISLDVNGAITGSPSLWAEDEFTSPNVVYLARVFTAAGEEVWETQFQIPSGTGTFSLNDVVPVA